MSGMSRSDYNQRLGRHLWTRISADMTFEESIVSPSYCVEHRSGETYYLGDDRTQLRWGDA
jgi:mannose-1-phosphate guanylyltransferase